MATNTSDPCITEGCAGTVQYLNTHRTGNAAAGQAADTAWFGQCPICDGWQQRELATGAITVAKGIGR